MTRPTAKDFHPEVLKLFDKYVHGLIPRRDFLRSAGKFAVGAATAEGLLQALSPRFAEAQQVHKNDPRITARFVEIPSPQGYGTVRGYLAQPAKAAGKLPTVLVVHENRGLNPHIEVSLAAWRSMGSSFSRRMRCFRSAAIPATRIRRANCSPRSIKPKRARILSLPPVSSRNCRKATARSARLAFATAAA